MSAMHTDNNHEAKDAGRRDTAVVNKHHHHHHHMHFVAACGSDTMPEDSERPKTGKKKKKYQLPAGKLRS